MSELQINNKWRITSDAHCWHLERRRIAGPESKTPGAITWTAVGYYGTLANAAASLPERHLRESDAQWIRAIQDAIIAIRLDISHALAA